MMNRFLRLSFAFTISLVFFVCAENTTSAQAIYPRAYPLSYPYHPYYGAYPGYGYFYPWPGSAYRPDYPPFRHATPRQLEDYDRRKEVMEQHYHPTPFGYYIGPAVHPSYRHRTQELARIQVIVPEADAEVWIADEKTSQTGEKRTFHSPPLRPGQSFFYKVMASWSKDGRKITETREVEVRGGEIATVDFNAPAIPLERLPAPKSE